MEFWMWGIIGSLALIAVGLFWPTKKGPRG